VKREVVRLEGGSRGGRICGGGRGGSGRGSVGCALRGGHTACDLWTRLTEDVANEHGTNLRNLTSIDLMVKLYGAPRRQGGHLDSPHSMPARGSQVEGADGGGEIEQSPAGGIDSTPPAAALLRSKRSTPTPDVGVDLFFLVGLSVSMGPFF